jgi:predicted acylesterase/phospholipase RssA
MKILSLDGGGIRGVLTSRLLQRLDEHFPKFLDEVDLLAGASIGGINALFLANGGSFEDLMKVYEERAGDIFKSRGLLDALTPDELWRADFAREDMDSVLEDVFGDVTMDQLQKDVLIPVFDTRSWNTKFYERDDEGVLVRDVAAMTSAAPTYWPTKLWSMDGGLFANNPSDSAVATAIRHLRAGGCKDGELAGRISCLSIGTGEVPHPPPSEDPSWDAGIKDMLPLLLDVVFDGAVKASHFRTKMTLNGRYQRINPRLPSVMSLKDVSKVPDLVKIADLEDLSEAIVWMEIHWGLMPKEGLLDKDFTKFREKRLRETGKHSRPPKPEKE